MEDIGEVIGLAFHVAAIAFLVLARKEFWAKVRRGALIKAAATLVAGHGRSAPWSAGACSNCSPAPWPATTASSTR